MRALFTALAMSLAAGSAQAQTVELELVLAIDASSSVDAAEFALQRDGVARAFMHPNVHAAISIAGQRGIAVTVLQWADNENRVVQNDWVLIQSASEAIAFGQQILAAQRMASGSTDIPGAIRTAVQIINKKKSTA
jgi:hypothetical protein